MGTARSAPPMRAAIRGGRRGWAARSAAHPRRRFFGGRLALRRLAAQRQTPAPIAEEVRALELVVNGALEVAAHRGNCHPRSVARELVEMVMRGAAGDRAPVAEGVALAPQVRARHPLA